MCRDSAFGDGKPSSVSDSEKPSASKPNNRKPAGKPARVAIRIRRDGHGLYRVAVGRKRFGFTAAAFLNAWHTGEAREWLEAKSIKYGVDCRDARITPSLLARVGANWVEVPRLSDSWGGARSHAGRRPTDDLPELRAECIAECAATNSEAPYLRYESQWERANGRKAPKKLLAGFRAELLASQNQAARDIIRVWEPVDSKT